MIRLSLSYLSAEDPGPGYNDNVHKHKIEIRRNDRLISAAQYSNL